MKMNNTIKSTLILTLTAFIWGMGFVAQRSGMEHVGPFFFSGLRMLLGAATLLVVIYISGLRTRRRTLRTQGDGSLCENGFRDKPGMTNCWNFAIVFHKKRFLTQPDGSSVSRFDTEEPSPCVPQHASVIHLMKGGAVCGTVLFLAGNFQQVGMVVTSASKAGFLTALYIVLVPIVGIFLKHKTHWNTWVSVAIAAIGLYFLCITANLDIQGSDLIVLIGALFWAIHILVIDRYVPALSQSDVLKLCMFQFAVGGILSLICALFFDGFFAPEGLAWADIVQVLPALLYAGILSTGAGFTLQAVGQKYANPSAASIIMSLEAVFSVVGGFLILNESFTGRETLGCVLMFAAVILAQMPIGGNAKSKAD